MNNNRSPLRMLAYFIVGLLMLIVAIQIAGVLLNLISRLITAVLSIVFIAAIVYLVYLLVRSAVRNLQ